MGKISVTIIVLNEEHNLPDCLESVRWADEVIVSDTGSTDATAEICRAYGAKVYTDSWLGFGAQKNLCAERAKNAWVLNLDADERVTPELKEEIIGAASDDAKAGYFIARKNYFGSRWIRRCGWYPDYNLRLYRKDKGRFSDRHVHEAVSVSGPTGRLASPMIHQTYKDVSDYLARMQRYSTLAAQEMLKEGRRAGVWDLMLRPPFTFLKMYILRGGFLEGTHGMILSYLYASYTLTKYAKLWELRRGVCKGL